MYDYGRRGAGGSKLVLIGLAPKAAENRIFRVRPSKRIQQRLHRGLLTLGSRRSRRALHRGPPRLPGGGAPGPGFRFKPQDFDFCRNVRRRKTLRAPAP